MSDEILKDLMKKAEHPENMKDTYAVLQEICTRLDNNEITDDEINELIKKLHYSDELKEFLQNDEETTLKK